MTIAKKIEVILEKSSWIRKMFEEGTRLKQKHGAQNVYDFSLGNPNIEPPDSFKTALKETVASTGAMGHAYMPNTGYPHVRKAVADYLTTEQGVQVTENEVIMTCGAAGALNATLKAITDPGDEIITPTPYFVEYNFYADNHGGILKPVPTKPDFTLDIDAISSAVNEKTKAIIINSPNNPTGQIYSKQNLKELGELLEKMGGKYGRTIYLISDEPYRKIVYDGHTVPSIFACYNESIVGTSYSKDLSIPGERIGFVAVNPNASFKKELLGGITFANRTLGFVNAPALMQRVIGAIQGECVDISAYARKRKLLCDGLGECGYEFITPPGTFYLFPKTPVKDDVEFIQALQEELILAVPGSGFGCPGYFRIAFCVEDETIKNAIPGFKKVIQKYH
ncbi:MAG: pyridoxal phosphate-dependent aminotransferase [Thermodesulfobacteriota bacterium]|nr:pyridoxal phosphate-dependent aminotransferase [Thermodesulfobacteriota bacterium]